MISCEALMPKKCCEIYERISGDDVLLVFLTQKANESFSYIQSIFNAKTCRAVIVNLNILNLPKIIAFFRRVNVGYTLKKSRMLTNLPNFLLTA